MQDLAVAFQVVMAQLIGGDAIHHACGIPVHNQTRDADSATASRMEAAKRLIQWRWIIINEIIMVSTALLGEMGVKRRGVIRDYDMQKSGPWLRDVCTVMVRACPE